MEATERTPVQSVPGGKTKTHPPRRLARKSVEEVQARKPQWPRKWLMPTIAISCLVLGIAVGVLLTRARYHAGQVVVAVNGETIDQDRFYRALENRDGAAVIRDLVGEELRYQFARKIGVAPTDATINAQFDAAVKSQPAIEQALADGRLSENDAKQAIRDKLVQDAVLTHGIQVSDDDIRRFYEANIDRKKSQALFYTPETAQVQVIITRTRAKAEQALQALANNVTWEVAAGNFSDDQSKLNGGMLPPIQRGRTVSKNVPGLEDAIFNLKIGDRTGPRQFSGLWWIIRCVDKRPEKTEPFDKVKDQCILGVKLSRLPAASRKKIEQDFATFQRQATIQAFWTQYKQAVNLK